MPCGTQVWVICLDALETHLRKTGLFSDQVISFSNKEVYSLGRFTCVGSTVSMRPATPP